MLAELINIGFGIPSDIIDENAWEIITIGFIPITGDGEQLLLQITTHQIGKGFSPNDKEITMPTALQLWEMIDLTVDAMCIISNSMPRKSTTMIIYIYWPLLE